MGVYENHLGGRICVAGYYPWDNLQNLSKSTQIKALMRWLSKDRMPAYVASFHRINIWARETQKENMAVTLTNSYLDPADGLTLMLLTDKDEIVVYNMDCVESRVRASGIDGAYRQFVLPEIDPWSMVLALTVS